MINSLQPTPQTTRNTMRRRLLLSLVALALALPSLSWACDYKCFQTTARYEGNLGGISGADAKCATEYPGFKFARNAWMVAASMSTPMMPPNAWLNHNSDNCTGWTTNSGNGISTPLFRQGSYATPNSHVDVAPQSNPCSNSFPIWCCNSP